jgi:membrane-associated HD superfamily phosphohydrolase
MIVDSCEALARTLSDRSRESVAKAVKKVVSDRMQLGQFDECEITLKELNIIIHTVINSLSGVYHSRIEYPKVSLEGIEDTDLEGGQEE